MCGIHGIISNSLTDKEIIRRLERMGSLQQHRGPDDKREDIFSYGETNVGFGFRRLSILDLETGMQPIICHEDKSAIICNGQIYNYIELKPLVSENRFTTKGDIEVALHLYRKYGLDFLQKLNGMYAGAIFDPANARLTLFRDRFGIKPLYYCEWENNFFFSSEIKPLLEGSTRPVELNHSRLATFFTYRYIPGSETMFYGIKRLPPGSYLEYDLVRRQYSIKRYWEYRLDRVDPAMDIDSASESFMELFKDAVRIRLRSDVEVGTLISGGIDSSAVSSQATEYKPDIRLFSISFVEEKYNELPLIKQFVEKNSDRFKHTRLYTRQCGIESLNKLPSIVRSLEEPVSLGTIIPTDQVCEMAGNKVKVVLTGEGSDEIFAGYRKFLLEMAAHNYPALPVHKQKELRSIYTELEPYMAIRDADPAKRYIQSESLFSVDELKMLIGQDIDDVTFPQDALPFLTGNEHPLNAAIAMESRARLPDYVILRLDKLSMRHSLETRTPFLDYRLAEFAAKLPVNFKANLEHHREKYICSNAFSRYAVLDHDTAFRKKQPFTIPLADWLSRPASLPEPLKEILLGDFIKKQGILDYNVLKKHLNRISGEAVGPQTLVSEADRVYGIIIFSLWYDLFF
jgi:asparagine synthase (glutamine-hydrolysing)